MKHIQLNLSRRCFLKTSAVGVSATVLVGPLVLRGRAASTAANRKVNLALLGCGGQGRGDLGGMLSTGEVNLVALCDPDAAQLAKARVQTAGRGGETAKAYEDYRRLLDDAATIDAVLIATPDHWHAPLASAFMRAGKHVYCEKPLAHSIGEARGLRELARTSKVATQMGNQGSASVSLRRGVEVIKAGALGQIRAVYHWGIYTGRGHEGSAPGEDPVPAGLNWDLWVGPSAARPFKDKTYHPATWRAWYDFGNGSVADFWCHAMNLPVRALDLGYPERLVCNYDLSGRLAPGKPAVEYHFGARGALAPVVIQWLGDHKPPAEVYEPLAKSETFGGAFAGGVPSGLLIVGEQGTIHTSHWNTDGLIRLAGDREFARLTNHAGTKEVPQTLPRSRGHAQEWLAACRDEGQTYSDFDTGGKLTEIGLAGVLAQRTGRSFDWDGERMEAKDAPELARFVKPAQRAKWLAGGPR